MTFTERIKELLDKIRAFWKKPKNRWLTLALLLLFFYLAGLLAQFLNNRYRWTPDMDLRLPSLNPLKALAMLFTPFGVQAVAGLFCFLLVVALLAFMNREDRAGMIYDKARNFWYSNKGVYGTAGWIGDPIYDAAEGYLLTALIFLQFEREDVEYPTLKGAYQVLLDTGDAEELDQYFSALQPPSRALAAYNLFSKASDNMKGNICLGLGTRLSVLQNEEIADLMCGGDMDLQMLGKKKMAYFLILSDQDNTTRFVAATFFSLLFLRLVQYADMECPDRRLPVPVTLLLDEFCSIVGSINGFPQKLSNIRSRGLQVVIIFQQLGQLMNRFPDNLWSEILGNVDTILCLGCSSDPVTAKFISDRSGEVTIYADTVMRQRNIYTPAMLQPNFRHSEGTGRRKLLTPDEVMRLDRQKLLVMVTGQQMLELDKFDYTRNPESRKFRPTPIRGLSIVPQPPAAPVDEAMAALYVADEEAVSTSSGKGDGGEIIRESGGSVSAPTPAVSPLTKKPPKASRGRKKAGKGVIQNVEDEMQLRIDDYVRQQGPELKGPADVPVPAGEGAAGGAGKTNGVQRISKPKI